MKISFDIGGVISKYPDFFRQILNVLSNGGIEVFILTDMHDMPSITKMVKENGFEIPESHILSADYDSYGEDCKAVLVKEHGIDIHVDDFIGYCANTACLNLLVFPNPTLPYYHPDWKTDGNEGNFGRRKASREAMSEEKPVSERLKEALKKAEVFDFVFEFRKAHNLGVLVEPERTILIYLLDAIDGAPAKAAKLIGRSLLGENRSDEFMAYASALINAYRDDIANESRSMYNVIYTAKMMRKIMS